MFALRGVIFAVHNAAASTHSLYFAGGEGKSVALAILMG